MKKGIVKILSGALALCLLCGSLFGCTTNNSDDGNGDGVTQSDLMQGYVSQMIAERIPDEGYYSAIRRVAAAMALKSLSVKENSGVSPLATVFGMSLAANGLSDKTQSEFLHALGDAKMGALNEHNATYAHILKKDTGASVLSSFRLGIGKSCFVPDTSFLQLNANYYGADGYRLSFAESDVNALVTEWITAKLGIQGMSFDAKCTAETASLLVDTLSVTGEFESGFGAKETAKFLTPDGEKDVSYLVSGETLYASTAKSKGFAKTMKNGLTFVALLPQGSVTLEQLMQSLDADTLKSCYDGITEKGEFGVKIPEFSFNSGTDVSSALKTLGIKAVFEGKTLTDGEKPEFTVGKILNVISVKLTENGFTTSANMPSASEQSSVASEGVAFTVFDKPFAFVVYDGAGVPLTIGTVVNP